MRPVPVALVALALAAGLTGWFGLSGGLPAAEAEAQRPVALPSEPAPRPKRLVSLPIEEALSPNQDARPAGMAIDTLIIHDTESPGVKKARTIANHFCNPRSQASAHYIIGKAGEVLQCVADEKRAWHAGPSKYDGREHVNDFSIGIELVNAQTGKDPFTNAQYQSLIALTVDLVSRHHIPLNRITGHRNVTYYPQYRRDPANNFDWNRYLSGVKAMMETCEVQRVLPTATEASRNTGTN
jgi:N-acetylmuramoyl-L-alanine amidase